MTKVVIITGANSGIGYNAAEKLVRTGNYEVILACRNDQRGSNAEKKLKDLHPNAAVTFMKLDLASLKSIHEFADSFHATGKPLHVLINNAGLTMNFNGKTIQHTEDGFEVTFGTNHLEDISFPFEFDNLHFEKPGTFNGLRAYGNSKLANIFFMYELVRRLKETGVTVTALTPGFIPQTGLLRDASFWAKLAFKLATPYLWLMNISRTMDHGGGMIFDLANKEEFKGVTGKYYKDNEEKDTSVESHDTEKGQKLWDISADLVKYEDAKALGV